MLRVMDAPGFYAAFPWGGYAQSKGATGTSSNGTSSSSGSSGGNEYYAPYQQPRDNRRV